MKPLVLDATNKSITVVMSGAAATTNPDYTAHYADDTGSVWTEASSDGVLNGTTPVTIIAAPAASTRRIINEITIQNRDTAAVTVTVSLVSGANTRRLAKATLQVDEVWTLEGAYDSNGAAKYVVGTGSGGSTSPNTAGGRITNSSSLAITTSDTTASSVWILPWNGDQVTLYNGTSWVSYTIPSAGVTLSTAALPANNLYDLFLYDSGSSVLAIDATAWTAMGTAAITGATNATPINITSTAHGLTAGTVITISGVLGNTAANGTWVVSNTAANTFDILTLAAANSVGNGAYTSGGTWIKAEQNTSRVTALATQNGVLVKTGALGRRYYGTIRINNNTGMVEDSVVRRFIYNYYNQVPRSFYVTQTSSHTYSTLSWRAWNNNRANKVEFIFGDTLQPFVGGLEADMTSSTTADSAWVAFGVNTYTTGTVPTFRNPLGSSIRSGAVGIFGAGSFSLGYNFISLVEYGQATGTGTMQVATLMGTILG